MKGVSLRLTQLLSGCNVSSCLQFVFWVFGTVLGGALGFLAMWHPALALSPYGLVAVVMAAALMVGLLGVTKARVGITLVLMTLSTLILVSLSVRCEVQF
jgi:hypothetical protein